MFDFLVIGAGLFGATFANLAKKAGKSVLVIDKHIHIARNSHAVNGEKNTIIFAKHKELTNTQSKVIFRRASDRVQMLRHGRCD
jgi:UDP-galactopyranose mutase